MSDPTMPHNTAHASYIAAVVTALTSLTIPWALVTARVVSPDYPRSAAIRLGDAVPDGPEYWLCWNELSGWFLGRDPDGRSGLTGVRWAHLGVLPAPAEVADWLTDELNRQPPLDVEARPYYRFRGDDDAAFVRLLAAYAVPAGRGTAEQSDGGGR